MGIYSRLVTTLMLVSCLTVYFFLVATEKTTQHWYYNFFAAKQNANHNLVTVVTAYYSIPSKFGDQRYYQWISNFLKIKDPVVVFTDKQNAKKIRTLAKPKLNIRIQVKPLSSTHISSLFPRSIWEQQFQNDPEKDKHKSFFLYWVWHEKSAFLKEVSLSNPFNSTAFAWVDIGAFRTDFFINKQVFSRATSRFLSLSSRIVLLNVKNLLSNNHTEAEMHGNSEIYLGGGIFAGNVSGIQRWNDNYYHQIKLWEQKGWFLGKDQPIMSKTCEQTASLCHIIQAKFTYGDPWFYLLHVFHRSMLEEE